MRVCWVEWWVRKVCKNTEGQESHTHRNQLTSEMRESWGTERDKVGGLGMAQFMKGLPNVIAFVLVTKGDHFGSDMTQWHRMQNLGNSVHRTPFPPKMTCLFLCPISTHPRLYRQCD